MPEYLLISGRDAVSVAYMPAVAADIISKIKDAQVDIAAPTAYADYARISAVVRRVISISPPTVPEMKSDAAGWKGKFSALAKNIATSAAQNFREYRDTIGELRITRYDAVFDFDAGAFSISVARAAKTDKIIGFAPDSLIDPIPGASLMYHDTRPVGKGDTTFLSRCRKLSSKYLNYSLAPMKWNINIPELPSWVPDKPFFLVGANTPAVFINVVAETDLVLVGDFDKADVKIPADATPGDIVAAAAAAKAVIDGGLTAILGTAANAPVFYIGDKAPDNTVVISTPAELSAALADLTTPQDSPLAKPRRPYHRRKRILCCRRPRPQRLKKNRRPKRRALLS